MSRGSRFLAVFPVPADRRSHGDRRRARTQSARSAVARGVTRTRSNWRRRGRRPVSRRRAARAGRGCTSARMTSRGGAGLRSGRGVGGRRDRASALARLAVLLRRQCRFQNPSGVAGCAGAISRRASYRRIEQRAGGSARDSPRASRPRSRGGAPVRGSAARAVVRTRATDADRRLGRLARKMNVPRGTGAACCRRKDSRVLFLMEPGASAPGHEGGCYAVAPAFLPWSWLLCSRRSAAFGPPASAHRTAS